MNLQGSYANGVEGGSVLLVVPHLPLGVVGSHRRRGVQHTGALLKFQLHSSGKTVKDI